MTNTVFTEVRQDFEVEFTTAIKWALKNYIIGCYSYKKEIIIDGAENYK